MRTGFAQGGEIAWNQAHDIRRTILCVVLGATQISKGLCSLIECAQISLINPNQTQMLAPTIQLHALLRLETWEIRRVKGFKCVFVLHSSDLRKSILTTRPLVPRVLLVREATIEACHTEVIGTPVRLPSSTPDSQGTPSPSQRFVNFCAPAPT